MRKNLILNKSGWIAIFRDKNSHELLSKSFFLVTQLTENFLTDYIWVRTHGPIDPSRALNVWRPSVDV